MNCGKTFEISAGEAEFYEKNNLALPKRCKACREKSKEVKSRKRKTENKRLYLPVFVMLFSFASLVVGSVLFKKGIYGYSYILFGLALLCFALYMLFIKRKKNSLSDDGLDDVSRDFTFRFKSADDLREHFLKHGAETHSDSPREYLKKANRLITSKTSLKKSEKEDNDYVFFDEKTGEIAFVSGKGFIRTYYISDKAYFNKQ